MSKINFYGMNKAELLDFCVKKCKSHNKFYYTHPNCYIKDKGSKYKIGFLDIETNGFSSDYNVLLCYCIKTADKDEILYGKIKKKDIMSGDMDKYLLEKCMDDLRKYDLIYTFYGSRFDIPFLRGRCVYHNIDFPVYNVMKHKDIYYMCRGKFKLHRNSLESVANQLGLKDIKTHIEAIHWQKALSGNRESLMYILNHCKADVILTELVYKRVNVYSRNINKSI